MNDFVKSVPPLPRGIAIVSIAIIIIGAVFPWGHTMDFSVKGFEGDGILTIGIGLVALAVIFVKRKPNAVTFVLGMAALMIGTIDFYGMTNANDGLNLTVANSSVAEMVKISIGTGLYLTIFGALGLVAGCILAYWQSRKNPSTQKVAEKVKA